MATTLNVLTLGCQIKEDNRSHADLKPENPLQKYHQCQDPRPTFCTREYHPVCAKRDTGIRCITSPCPSSEQVTKPNACVACSDKDVLEFTHGACTHTST